MLGIARNCPHDALNDACAGILLTFGGEILHVHLERIRNSAIHDAPELPIGVLLLRRRADAAALHLGEEGLLRARIVTSTTFGVFHLARAAVRALRLRFDVDSFSVRFAFMMTDQSVPSFG